MKRNVALLLVLALLVTIFAPISAFGARNTSVQDGLAGELSTLNMFKGDAPGVYRLGDAPTRIEAVVMIIRMLGQEKEATRVHWANTFLDLPEWADTYIGYAKNKGLTNGESQTTFGTGNCTPQMYLTFTLRALGYDDVTAKDFSWDKPETLAREIGILSDDVNLNEFLRADVVTICVNALSAKVKNSEKTLAETLIEKGVFTKADYLATSFGKGKLPADPETPSKAGFYEDYEWLPDLGNALGLNLTERKTYNDGYQYRYSYADMLGKDSIIALVQEYYYALPNYGITPTNATPGMSYTAFYTDYVVTIRVLSEMVYLDVQYKYAI